MLTRVWLDGWGHGSPVTVEMPANYRRVYSGAVRPGDLCLDRLAFKLAGVVAWVPVETDQRWPYTRADVYSCVIRNDGGPCPEVPCEACGAAAKRPGYRYCRECADVVLAEQRRLDG